jgi:benzoyl-CoA reductase/2-hydroxyglutaryl-CoA dehydratase subunit BcrC/BadD/HgdB
MDMSQCRGFFLDAPFRQTEQENDYLKKELEDMIGYLEEQTGHRLNWDKLSENIERVDRQLQLHREIDELRGIIPSPFPPQDFLKLFTVDCFFAGTREATHFLEAVRRELLETVESNKDKPNRERFRIMDIHMPPVLSLGAIEKMSLEHGAVSVADPFFSTWGEGRLDPSKPLESMIKKIYLHPVMEMHGPLDERVTRKVIDCAQKHSVHGAIHWAHVGCRQSAALIKYIKDALADIDVPVLVIDCDIIDATVAPQEEIGKHLTQFFELLEERL